MMKLLLFERHAELTETIQAILEAEGHELSVQIPLNVQPPGDLTPYDAVLLFLPSSGDLSLLPELCRRIRSFTSCKHSPILALSEKTLSYEEFQEVLQAGVQDYLGPPFQRDPFLQRLLVLSQRAQESARYQRRIRYLTQKQQRRQRTEKALRTSMQDALKKSWDYLEILNDSLEDAIVTLTMPERVIEYGNRAVETILGYTIEECQGESFDIFFPDHRGKREFAQQLNEAISSKQSSLHSEHILRKASGMYFTAELTTTFMFEQDKLTRTVSSIRDITERKEMEQALEEERTSLARKVEERTGELQMANKELAQASQHKDRFLANMSHELRTPLNAILGYAKILQKGKDLTQLQQDGLRTIQRSGEHLLHLITDILDLSKIEAGRMELHLGDLYLPDFLRHIADMIRLRAEDKAIAFNFEYDEDLPLAIQADEKCLREILVNLLDNAVKFTTEGEVLLRIKLQNRSEGYAWLLFEVEDSGIGISPEYLDAIFQPFQQGDSQRYSSEGTGLGLTICRQLARLMGAELEVHSIPDVGTTFSFVLEAPVLEDFVPSPEELDKDIVGYEGSVRKILIVDDKAENRTILHEILAPLGFSVFEAESGLDCLALLAEESFDLLVLDLRMAELDGFETARRIRRLPGTEAVKILVSSASVFEETRQKSLTAGCDEFLPKPIDEEELLDALQRQLHLSWITQERVKEKSVAPFDNARIPAFSASDIDELRTFARHGNITRILKFLERIETEGAEYQPFVQTLRAHVTSFQMKKVLECIEDLKKTQ